MVDKALAGGLDVEGTFTPDELYAGESDVVSTQDTVAAGTAALAQYQVVALVGGFLVAYNHAGVDGSEKPYGVLPHAIDASASLVDLDTPVFTAGVFNFDKLVAGGATLAQLKASTAGTELHVQKLY